MNAAGTAIVASTYIGGGNREIPVSAVIDSNDAIWIGGETRSADFPTTRGAYDRTFNGGDNDTTITGIDATLSTLIYSTFLGGFVRDWSSHVEVDGPIVYNAAGTAWSSNFPTTAGAYDTTFDGNGVTTGESFVTRIDTSTATLDTDGDGMPDCGRSCTVWGTRPATRAWTKSRTG